MWPPLEELYIHATEYCAASKKQRLSLLSTFCMLNLFTIISFKDFPGGLISQLVKNLSTMQLTPVRFLSRKIRWRRDRLPTPVFLDFPCGSAGKESTCNVRDLDLIPGLGRSPERRERLLTVSFWLGEFHGLYSPWGCEESDMTE